MDVSEDLRAVAGKVERGERLSAEDALACIQTRDLAGLGAMANLVREKRHGAKTTYVVNSHLNYSNLCTLACKFCAFARAKGRPGAYELSMPQILEKADRAAAIGASELHIVGGLHPDWPYAAYPDMLRTLRSRHPQMHLKAFTAVEIRHFAGLAGKPIAWVLDDLRKAGLGSLPGGGAEIFAEAVRKEICGPKDTSEEWLEVHRVAHGLGLRSTATLLYGHIESAADRVDHLMRLRGLQDETGGFLAFIPLSFHPDGTRIAVKQASGMEDLRTIAVSRLVLDNIDHIKAYWTQTGLKVAQLALHFGADDVDGTVVEETITHMAGGKAPRGVGERALRDLIRSAGRVPVRRDTLHRDVEEAA